MVMLVTAVGAVAVSIHELAGLREASRTTRALFTVAWTLANVAICATGLYRIRMARNARRGSPPTGR
jgi:hypothetical protein